MFSARLLCYALSPSFGVPRLARMPDAIHSDGHPAWSSSWNRQGPADGTSLSGFEQSSLCTKWPICRQRLHGMVIRHLTATIRIFHEASLPNLETEKRTLQLLPASSGVWTMSLNLQALPKSLTVPIGPFCGGARPRIRRCIDDLADAAT
jgi:hypothetical protein